jgi:hypothetical protein
VKAVLLVMNVEVEKKMNLSACSTSEFVAVERLQKSMTFDIEIVVVMELIVVVVLVTDIMADVKADI